MKQQIYSHKLPNGLTLVGEPLSQCSAAGMSLLVPMGAATDEAGEVGAANLLCEMFQKGTASYSARELSQEFENIGALRNQSAGVEASIFSTSFLGEKLRRTLELSSQMLFSPSLPAEELESVRELALQDLRSVEDEPAQKVMIELAKNFYPEPFGRSQLGTEAGLVAVTIGSLKDYYKRGFIPEGAILGVAGAFHWEEFCGSVQELFGDWKGSANLPKAESYGEVDRAVHLEKDTSQVQIALAYPSVSYDHPDYYAARVAVGVLSGGMSGRLFIEVREKRGLVYRVSASHSGICGRPAVFAYAGTTPENAEETLEVLHRELVNLKNGVSDEELTRAKADIKSRVVMQSELSSVRAGAIVNDWWNLGRVRSIEELKKGIDAVTSADIERHLEEYPVRPATLATLGPKSLELPA